MLKGMRVTEINDLKLSVSNVCDCVCGPCSGDFMQKKALSLTDGLI